MVQALVFLGVAFSVVGLIHYYLWRRLVRDTTRTRPGPPHRHLGRGRRCRAGRGHLHRQHGAAAAACAAVLSWPGYLWLAVMFYLLVVLAVLEIPALVARIVLRRTGRGPPSRRPEPVLVGRRRPRGRRPRRSAARPRTAEPDPPVGRQRRSR